MVKGWLVALGIGLVILGLTGLSRPGESTWMTWFEFIMAAASFVLAGMIRPGSRRNLSVGGPALISGGLFVMWLVGISTGIVAWLSWWTFAFACAYGLLAISAAAQRRTEAREVRPVREEEREKPRRVA